MSEGQHHGAGHCTGGFVTAQYPHQREGELDGGARPWLVIRRWA